MPPKVRVTRQAILEAALEIVRQKGPNALNARSLAGRLGCSVQPVFREFSSMQALHAAVVQTAQQLFDAEMLAALGGEDGFLGMGMTYIGFAGREKNLFQLLFMSGGFGGASAVQVAGTTQGDDEVLAALQGMTGLDAVRAQRLYTGIWFTTHGIASLVATGECTMQQDEVRKALHTAFTGLLFALKQEEENET